MVKDMTEANLRSAYAGESQAHMRYIIYMDMAKKEGFPNVARLFHAAAYAERGESFEIAEMYPAYRAVAQAQGEKGADTSFYWAMEAEKNHLELYKRAKTLVDQGKDADFGPIQVCPVCGHTIEGDAPHKCPVCNTPGDQFKTF
jgi:rubrerythrin